MRRKEIILAGVLFGFLSLIAYPAKNAWAVCRDTALRWNNVETHVSWYRSDSESVCRAGVEIRGRSLRLEFAGPFDANFPNKNEVNRAISCEGVLQAKMANHAIIIGGKEFDCNGTPFLREGQLGVNSENFFVVPDTLTDDPTGGAALNSSVDFLANVVTFTVYTSGNGCRAFFNIPNSSEGFITESPSNNGGDIAAQLKWRGTIIQQCNMITAAFFHNRSLHVRGTIKRRADNRTVIPTITINNLKID